MAKNLYVFDEYDGDSVSIAVTSVKPTDDNYDEVDSYCFRVPVPKGFGPESVRNVVMNTLSHGGALVVYII
jgi:hypothetical protein